MYFKSWIQSGIHKIKYLQFTHRKLDETFIYRTVNNKANIYTETLLIKRALEPYTQLITNAHNTNVEANNIVKLSTKQMYTKLVQEKYNKIKPDDMCPHLDKLSEDINISIQSAFKNQLCSKIEYKLKEFNFKVMHGILPCNANLAKWGITDNDVCDVCDSRQSIEHLLFECHRARIFWEHFTKVYKVNVRFSHIVCGCNENADQVNTIVNLVGFLLYKEWLINSIEHKNRSIIFPVSYFIKELQLREQIYCVSGRFININPLIDSLLSNCM